MSGALAGCLALSLRYAAQRTKVTAALRTVSIAVAAYKAPDLPSRVARFEAEVTLDADLPDATRHALLEEAERLCTVSNTLLAAGVEVVATLKP
jgi:uncharacterized OsmC-like protein